MALPASTLTHLECSICSARHEWGVPQSVCSACGRALLARYDLGAASRSMTREELRRREASMWRYAEVLPASELAGAVSLGEGMTPLLPAPQLGAELGLGDLLVKDEGANPTGSFKARGLAAATAMARRLGITDIALPTAGNAGSAAAAYAARGGLTAHIAMPADTPEAIVREVIHLGADLHLVDGLIDDAGGLIAGLCSEHGWFDLSTLKEPYRAEGKKTMGYELWEQLDGELPDVVLYPTGGGTGLIGMWKAFDELEEMGLLQGARPRMYAVQSDGCAPVVRAWKRGDERCERWPGPATVAPGIRVPSPFADDLILRTLRESGGAAVAIPDASIVPAMRRLGRLEGIDACPEGAATVIGLELLLAAGAIRHDERIVLFNTGTGLKHPELRPASGPSRPRQATAGGSQRR